MNCPSCGSPRLFPSRLRGPFEAIRRRLTDRQPYRCHACSWRGWRLIATPEPAADVQPDDLRSGQPAVPLSGGELDPLDPAGRDIPPVSEVDLDRIDPDRQT
jgi:hypothetical protein